MAWSGRGLAAADLLFNLMCITPLVQLHQYATWALCEFLPFTRKGNAWTVFGISVTLEITIMVMQKVLESRSANIKSKFVLSLWYKFYVYMLSASNASHAWSATALCEMYVGIELSSALMVTLTGAVALWSLSCGRNILGNPYGLEVDTQPDFGAKTMFQTSVDFSVKNILDVVFTVLVVYTQIHYLWFGIWTTWDRTIFPNDPWLAMLTSVGMGYLVTVAFLQLQHKASEISHQLEKKSARKTMIIFEDVFLLFATAFSVMLCKGLWMFFDLAKVWYPVVTGDRDVTLWAYHFTAFAILVGFQCSGSLCLRGIERDGTYSSGEGVKFSTGFFGGVFSATDVADDSSVQGQDKEKSE